MAPEYFEIQYLDGVGKKTSGRMSSTMSVP